MPPSKYKIVKDGWGTRSNFQGSYGLGMAPNDLEQGEKILDAMLRANKEEDKEGGTTVLLCRIARV